MDHSPSNSVSIAIYLIRGFLVLELGFIFLLAYLLFIVFLEMRLLSKSCANCYYYGRPCAFGKGRICAMVFKKGDEKRRIQELVTWKAILPDLLVYLVPLIIGIALLILSFDWLILIPVVALTILSSLGNGFIRASFACKYCRQRGIGCPAEKLFNRSNQAN